MLPIFGPKKGLWLKCRNPLRLMVRLAGFEPATYGLEVRCSIQLSYRRKGIVNGIVNFLDTICSSVCP